MHRATGPDDRAVPDRPTDPPEAGTPTTPGPRRSMDAGMSRDESASSADGEGLPFPRTAEEAARMERKARDAERHIRELHEDADPDADPIHEE